jgi:serine/threonine-protein kinase
MLPVPTAAPTARRHPTPAGAPDVTELASDLQRTLGDAYAIERELAPGGMSRLFLARDVALRRRVAIKVLPRSLVAVVSVDRFKREIMLAAGLQHPHIVPVLSAGEIDGLPYYVMPFVEGESLRARIARGPLSVRETVSVMKDVARALAYAHAQGVIHRDVKPDNILLSAGAAMVADFGVAKAISASRVQGTGVQGAAAPAAGATITGMGISLGTPAYMAPEQVTADPAVGHRADLYALGVVAYEMLAGAPPFRGRSAQQVLASHVAEAPVPITTRRYDVPDALADLIMACLQKDPALRPKAAADLVRALEDATTSSGAFEPPRLVPRITRRQRQRLAGLLRPALLGVAAVAVLAAVAWSVVRPDADDPGPGTADPAGALPAATPAAPAASGIGVAVLPLANLGTERADSVLAQGLTSAFIDALSGMAGVRVASLTASRTAAGGEAPPAEIGRALDASFLVEGTVQRQGDRVRVTVRLVRAGDGTVVWSQALDRTAGGDLLALQDDVTRTVAAALAPRLGASPAPVPAAAPAAPPADTGD